jgi:hypothetical protein
MVHIQMEIVRIDVEKINMHRYCAHNERETVRKGQSGIRDSA